MGGSAGVLEVVEDHRSDTFRPVYTVKFAGWIYVLHCARLVHDVKIVIGPVRRRAGKIELQFA